jgi:hypothetical protein
MSVLIEREVQRFDVPRLSVHDLSTETAVTFPPGPAAHTRFGRRLRLRCRDGTHLRHWLRGRPWTDGCRVGTVDADVDQPWARAARRLRPIRSPREGFGHVNRNVTSPVGNSASARGFAGIRCPATDAPAMHSADRYPFSQPAGSTGQRRMARSLEVVRSMIAMQVAEQSFFEPARKTLQLATR